MVELIGRINARYKNIYYVEIHLVFAGLSNKIQKFSFFEEFGFFLKTTSDAFNF